MRGLLAAALIAILGASPALAVGPTEMARADRSLWPEPIGSEAGFDLASRAEILSFALALEGSAPPDVERAWRDAMAETLAENFRRASAACRPAEWLCDPRLTADALARKAALVDDVPSGLTAWRENARAFHRVYAAELLRLAVLFPHPTSEVKTLSDREKTGLELPDRRFLLTFDDGPSRPGGSTDSLLELLRRSGHSGVFYMLGERVEARLGRESAGALRARFEGQCVASHGWTHRSHQGLRTWQASVTDTDRLLRETFGPRHRSLFRPPYGQRKPDSGPFFAEQGLQVALWNIDSQDWSASLDADEVEGRVLSLMLLWRRGVILFHDVHDKARLALPKLWEATRGSGIVWLDACVS